MEDYLSGLHDLEFVGSKIIMAAGTAFRISRASIHAIRVMASIMRARLEECRAAQDFTHRFGGDNSGYFQVDSDNEHALRLFEQRMCEAGVEYARLPRLQDGATQYMYPLEHLSELRDCLSEFEADRIVELQNRKERFGGETDAYDKAKSDLLHEMPDVRLISMEEYCRSSFRSDGTETQNFQKLYESAKEAEQEAGLDKQSDIAGFTKTILDIDRDEKIDSGELISVTVSSLEHDTLIRNGEIKQIAKIPVDDGKYCLIIPEDAVQENGNILIEKVGKYQLIQDDCGKTIEQPGYAVVDLLQKKTDRTIVPEKTPEEIKVPVPEIKRGRKK